MSDPADRALVEEMMALVYRLTLRVLDRSREEREAAFHEVSEIAVEAARLAGMDEPGVEDSRRTMEQAVRMMVRMIDLGGAGRGGSA